MRKVELMKKLEEFNKFDDLMIDEFEDEINITIEDFEGFDKNWCEVGREVEIDVNEFIKFLQDNSISYEMDFYSTFDFEDCYVQLGYSSYDI